MLAGSAISGIAGSRAADEAAGAADAATRMTVEEQRRQYDQTRADFAPYREAGSAALGRLEDPNASYEQSFGYNFLRNEGLRDLQNMQAVRGGGGNAMRELVQFNQGLAGQDFNNWWNRQAGLVDAGRGAATSTATAGMNAANAMGNAYMQGGRQIGAARAGEQLNWGNAINSGIQNAMYAWQTRPGPAPLQEIDVGPNRTPNINRWYQP
jgi:hypothetical protein